MVKRGAYMGTIGRFVAHLSIMLTALTVGFGTPAAAQDTTGEYRGAIDSMFLEIRALWGELDRFQVQRRYCVPPPPSKAEAQAELAALEKRVLELNGRYNALKQSLLSFLDHNHRLYTEMMVNGRDPRNRQWWSRDDNNRQRMIDELNAKKAALAAAPEGPCGQTAKPTTAVTTGQQPPVQPPKTQPAALPQRPAYDPLNWPPFPPHFCSWDEYWKFINERINPLYEKAAENALLASRFRTQVEVAINNLVQADKPVPAALQALRRQAIADVAAQDRLSRESEDIRRRAKAIPVIDCRQPTQQADTPRTEVRTGQAPQTTPTTREKPQWAAGLDSIDTFKVGLQQRTIDDVEADLKALDDMARRRGACGALYDEADDIDYGLDELEDSRAFPPDMIRDWRTRLDDIMDGCPAPRISIESRIRFELPSDPRMRIILEEHNKERAQIGVPLLRWDPQLAAGAMTYAAELARTGQRVHAPREGRGAVRENLNQGMLGWSAGQMMQNWLKEERNFYPGTYPNVTRTGNWQDVSHYTQMIWPTTTHIGCGLSSGSGYQWLVCRYSPGGNKDGQPVGLPSDQPIIAKPGDVAPPDSSRPTFPVNLPMPKFGGGMTQIDPPAPPPPPPPTARDPAPEGDEGRHPLKAYFNEAFDRHADAVCKGDKAAQEAELAKMKYALDELKKRLKAAKKAGRFSTVRPEDVQRQIDGLQEKLRLAEVRQAEGQCPASTERG